MCASPNDKDVIDGGSFSIIIDAVPSFVLLLVYEASSSFKFGQAKAILENIASLTSALEITRRSSRGQEGVEETNLSFLFFVLLLKKLSKTQEGASSKFKE